MKTDFKFWSRILLVEVKINLSKSLNGTRRNFQSRRKLRNYIFKQAKNDENENCNDDSDYSNSYRVNLFSTEDKNLENGN